MESKTSYFNSKLFTRDIKSYAPFWGVFIFVILLVYILPMYIMESVDNSSAEGMIEGIIYIATNPIAVGFLSILSAVFTFSYIYKRRSAYMLHALPINRTEHFVTHYLSGLTMVAIIGVVAYLCAFMFNYTSRVGVSDQICYAFLNSVIETLFFYSLAVFVCMVCGNALLSVITYVVLNSLWLFINLVVGMIQSLIVIHPVVENAGDGIFVFQNMDILLPVLYFVKRVGAQQILFFGASSKLNYTALWQCAIMLIPAAGFVILSLILYKRRPMEKVGETVAFDWCKVVFRVLFTVCGASLITGIVLISMIDNGSYDRVGNAVLVALFMTIGGAISFVVSEMILNKSVHIFKKKMPYLQGVIPIGAIIITVCLATLGVFTPKTIPDADEVVGITIEPYYEDGANKYIFTNPETVERILESQENLISDQEILDQCRKYKSHSAVISEATSIYNTSVRVYSKSKEIRHYEYEVDQNHIEKIVNSYMPIVNESSNIETAIFGDKPDDLKIDGCNFTNLHDISGYRWSPSVLNNVEYDYEGDGYVAQSDGGVTIGQSVDDDSIYTISGLNLAELYEAVRADLREGNIHPFAVTPYSVSHRDVKDSLGVLELNIGEKDNKSDNITDIYDYNYYRYNLTTYISLTPQSKHTIEFLKKYNAITGME